MDEVHKVVQQTNNDVEMGFKMAEKLVMTERTETQQMDVTIVVRLRRTGNVEQYQEQRSMIVMEEEMQYQEGQRTCVPQEQ